MENIESAKSYDMIGALSHILEKSTTGVNLIQVIRSEIFNPFQSNLEG